MKRHPRALLALLLLLLVLSTAGVVALAQTSAGFNLEWHVIGGGGGQSTSADYFVNGTIGQSLAGPPQSTGGPFVVSSGYWQEATVIYLPVARSR